MTFKTLDATGDELDEFELHHPKLYDFLFSNNILDIRDKLLSTDLEIEDLLELDLNSPDFVELCKMMKLGLKHKVKFKKSLKNFQKLQNLRQKYIVSQSDKRYLKLYKSFRQDSNKSLRTSLSVKRRQNSSFGGFADITYQTEMLSGKIPVLNAIIIGESKAGKTSMLLRMTKHTFNPNLKRTTKTDFNDVMIDLDGNERGLCDNIVKLNLWDCPGQEEYRASVITKSILRKQNAIIMVYDISNPQSFNALSNWYNSIDDIIDTNEIAVFVIGCKKDLSNKVFTENAKEFAIKIGGTWSDCSSKTGEGIIETLVLIAEKAYRRKQLFNMQNSLRSNLVLEDSIKIQTKEEIVLNKKNKNSCC